MEEDKEEEERSSSLITVTAAEDVTDEYRAEARASWDRWDSKNRKSFRHNYEAEERILILSGSAVLAPTLPKTKKATEKGSSKNNQREEESASNDGGTESDILIEAGMAVTFRAGFQCKWKITKRMTKYYAVFGSNAGDGDEAPDDGAAITCDACGKGCFEESYFVRSSGGDEEEELDICPACYQKERKTAKYKGAEHQKQGTKWEEEPKKKKSSSNSSDDTTKKDKKRAAATATTDNRKAAAAGPKRKKQKSSKK